tara:strand:- start:463 stop:867 length:405 start_codon:yes stop_codon:yes gene_type:complete
MSSLNTKKRKAKKLDMAKVEIKWRQYNKEMRRKHMHSCQFDTLDEYVAYISGKLKPKKRKFVPYEPKTTAPVSKPDYPSVSPKSPVHGIPEAGRRKESPKYTGDYIVGIATMHKSNAVPITNQEQAIEIARMAK